MKKKVPSADVCVCLSCKINEKSEKLRKPLRITHDKTRIYLGLSNKEKTQIQKILRITISDNPKIEIKKQIRQVKLNECIFFIVYYAFIFII